MREIKERLEKALKDVQKAQSFLNMVENGQSQYDEGSKCYIEYQRDIDNCSQDLKEKNEIFLGFIESEIELAVTTERKRMSDWASKNYSRSAAPLYAHVDVVELIENINTK